MKKMPVLFVGHGSPMNAIEENEFSLGWRAIAKSIPEPEAILCISAHWETRGTWVTAMEHPRTIHDFSGFPRSLFLVEYPAPGSPQLASETKQLIRETDIGLDDTWGLDHGTWSVIRNFFPDANIPVIQLSLDHFQKPQKHFDLAKELIKLRDRGVLIVGSGNMVHNLGLVAWDRLNEIGYGFDWALEANDKMKKFIMEDDYRSLIDFRAQGKAFDLAVPTAEHYLPLLYTLALKEKNDTVTIFNDKPVAGSLSMTSILIS